MFIEYIVGTSLVRARSDVNVQTPVLAEADPGQRIRLSEIHLKSPQRRQQRQPPSRLMAIPDQNKVLGLHWPSTPISPVLLSQWARGCTHWSSSRQIFPHKEAKKPSISPLASSNTWLPSSKNWLIPSSTARLISSSTAWLISSSVMNSSLKAKKKYNPNGSRLAGWRIHCTNLCFQKPRQAGRQTGGLQRESSLFFFSLVEWSESSFMLEVLGARFLGSVFGSPLLTTELEAKLGDVQPSSLQSATCLQGRNSDTPPNVPQWDQLSHITLIVPLLPTPCDYQDQHEFMIVSGDKQTSINKILFNSFNCLF